MDESRIQGAGRDAESPGGGVGQMMDSGVGLWLLLLL